MDTEMSGEGADALRWKNCRWAGIGLPPTGLFAMLDLLRM